MGGSVSINYRGYVWEIPPNGQGIAALIALNILEGFEVRGAHTCPVPICTLIESMKLALPMCTAMLPIRNLPRFL